MTFDKKIWMFSNLLFTMLVVINSTTSYFSNFVCWTFLRLSNFFFGICCWEEKLYLIQFLKIYMTILQICTFISIKYMGLKKNYNSIHSWKCYTYLKFNQLFLMTNYILFLGEKFIVVENVYYPVSEIANTVSVTLKYT